jgi:hypothetical protein
MELQLSWQIFEKFSNILFHENPPVGAELFHVDWRLDRQTNGRKDRYDEGNSRFSQFCESA